MQGKRLLSLDALRGLAVAGMILVSAPGNGDMPALLQHSAWNGCTIADLVFPLFLFALGMSAALSLSYHLDDGMARSRLFRLAAGRAAVLFIFGIAGNGVPVYFNPDLWRVMGVLQRIALCYLGAAGLFLTTEAATQAALGLALPLGYWALLSWVPSPGHLAGDMTAGGNLACWLDRVLLPGHLLGGSYDSEGLLSTLPAFATTIAGLLAGRWLLARRLSPPAVAALLAACGAMLMATGLAWAKVLPMNKHLWTSSFGAFATGASLCLFAVLYWILEVQSVRQPFAPLIAYGRNAFLVYVLSFLLLVVQDSIPMTLASGASGTLRTWLAERLFARWAGAGAASWLYAAGYTALWLPLVGWLYQRGIAVRASLTSWSSEVKQRRAAVRTATPAASPTQPARPAIQTSPPS